MADEKAEKTVDVDEKDGKDPQAAAGQPKGAKLGMFVVVIFGLLVMTLTPVITFFVVKAVAVPQAVSEAGGHKEAKAEGGGGGHGAKKEGGGHGGGEGKADSSNILSLKSVMVNIADTKSTRVLRLEVHLVVSDVELVGELKNNYMSMLLDRVMFAASRKTLDELEGPQGRESLKRDIIGEINSIIKNKLAGAITDVYFVEYLIQ